VTKIEDRIIRRLEAQVERAQAHLTPEPQRSSPIGFLGGLALGTVAGALLTFFFTRDEDDVPDTAASDNDEAIVPRERSTGPREQASPPRPLAAVPTAPEEGVTDQLAAAELESAKAVTDIARESAATDTRMTAPAQAIPAKPATADAEQERSAATPSGQVAPIDGECPITHPIKGNKGSMGALIYHNRDSVSYDRTNPEVCFATEKDAESAGYRAPRG